jgi:hypothetical protein
MSETEKALAEIIKNFAKQDEHLRHLYVELKDLESISQTYATAKDALNEARNNILKSSKVSLEIAETQKQLFQRIEELTRAMQDLHAKLSDAEIHSFRLKLDDQNSKLDDLDKSLGQLKVLITSTKSSANWAIGVAAISVIAAFVTGTQ